jgi:N-methylhydantoinase B
MRGVDVAKGTILLHHPASPRRDGRDARSRRTAGGAGFPASISNTPVEVAETLAPILFRSKRLADDPGGAGARHGGSGQVVSFQLALAGTVAGVAADLDRTRVPAEGILGGEPGVPVNAPRNGEAVENPEGACSICSRATCWSWHCPAVAVNGKA